MEIFKKLPPELKLKILYKHGGLEHKTAKIMKDFIKDKTIFFLFDKQIYPEPNFYEYLRDIHYLKYTLGYAHVEIIFEEIDISDIDIVFSVHHH
jgi:hypothetical protein